ILLVALGWGVLSRAPRAWAALVCAGIITEFLVMFWSHWWLLTLMPEVLESLPGNAGYKMDRAGNQEIFFLNECLGSGQYVFLAGALAIQLMLCLLLFRDIWRFSARPQGES